MLSKGQWGMHQVSHFGQMYYVVSQKVPVNSTEATI